MNIDIKNIDNLIFEDKKLVSKYPEITQIYNQWLIGVKNPSLRFMAKRARLDLLKLISNNPYLSKLEEYFNEKINVLTIDHNIVKTFSSPTDSFEDNLNHWNTEIGEFKDMILHRNKEQIEIIFWR